MGIARALIELGQHEGAELQLATLEAMDRREWRGNWYRGLSLLAQGRPFDAGLAFDIVYSEVPGELVPQLALGFAAEAQGDHAEAVRRYEIVSAADHSFAAASFGLARSRLALGDVAGAVEAYERVPLGSSLRQQAQLAIANNSLLDTSPSDAWVNQAKGVLANYGVALNPVSTNLLTIWPADSRTGPAWSGSERKLK